MGRHGGGYLFKRGQTWWLCYTIAGKVLRESLGTRDKRQAEAERQRRLAPLAAGGKTARLEAVKVALETAKGQHQAAAVAARDKLAVADAWAAFVSDATRPQPAAITLKDYRERWGKFAVWWATHAPDRPALEQVTRADLNAFAAYLESERLSPNRFNKCIQTAALVATTLLPEGHPNPFASTHRKRLATRSHRELSETELRAVIDAAQGELRLLFVLGLFTLYRLGDCCLLQWGEVDLIHGTINRKPNKTASRSGKVVAVTIHPVLRALLEQIPAAARQGDVLPTLARLYRHDRTKVSRRVQAHFSKCGILTKEDAGTAHRVARVGFHSLRHAGASIMARAGTPQATLQYLLGHASPALQAVYVHTNAGDVSRAIDALPDVVTPPTNPPAPPAPTAASVVAQPDGQAVSADSEAATLRQEVAALLGRATASQLAAALAAIQS